MDKTIQLPEGIKLKLKSGSRRLKLVALVAAVLCTVTLLCVHIATVKTRQDTEAMRNEAQVTQQENSRLEQYIRELGTIQGIIRIAQEELGLVEPGTVIFDTN